MKSRLFSPGWWIFHVLMIAAVLGCAGCGANGSAQAGGGDSNAHGMVKIGVPF